MQIVDVQMPMKNFYPVEINVKNQHALMTSQLQHAQLSVKDGVNVKLDMSVLQMDNVSDKNFVHRELIVPQMNIGTFVVVPVLNQLARIQTAVVLERKQLAHKYVKLVANVWPDLSARVMIVSRLLIAKLIVQQTKNFWPVDLLAEKLNVQTTVVQRPMHEIQTSLKISTRIILKMIKLILILVTMHSLIFFPTVHPFVSDDVNAKLDS
jgi:hypothetical protein